jgi:CRISPR/Cas system CSM-associated protein Csm3 (group 7 of RAMP superfamily)
VEGLPPTLDEGAQSPLIVFDALGWLPENATAEVRDGVAIHPGNGTADDHFKYDAEVLPPGTTFHVRLDLLVGRVSDEAAQMGLLAAALSGLGRGEIGIGARQSRGLGGCRARKWRVRRFDLASRDGWLAWLGTDIHHPMKGMRPHDDVTATLRDAAGGRVRIEPPADRREVVHVEVDLTTHGGLLVRSSGLTAEAADATPLTSGGKPVLPGTSVAGALRARALRIARVVRGTQNDGERWVKQLFGPRPRGDGVKPCLRRGCGGGATCSRQQVLRQRQRIDRITGGVVDGELFDGAAVPRLGDAAAELRSPQPGRWDCCCWSRALVSATCRWARRAAVGRGVVTGKVRPSAGAGTARVWPLLPCRGTHDQAASRAVEEFGQPP